MEFPLAPAFVLALVSISVTAAPPQLPDTSGIDFVLTDNLNVDQFFSLWLVFNNDEVKMSGMFSVELLLDHGRVPEEGMSQLSG
jgi:hypothetical protein